MPRNEGRCIGTHRMRARLIPPISQKVPVGAHARNYQILIDTLQMTRGVNSVTSPYSAKEMPENPGS